MGAVVVNVCGLCNTVVFKQLFTVVSAAKEAKAGSGNSLSALDRLHYVDKQAYRPRPWLYAYLCGLFKGREGITYQKKRNHLTSRID